jgi:hypothetical protein
MIGFQANIASRKNNITKDTVVQTNKPISGVTNGFIFI